MKKALFSMGLALVLVATQAGYGRAQGQRAGLSGGDGPSGSWLVRGETAAQGQFNVLLTFHDDGTVIADEASAFESAGHGTWKRQGPSRYGYTFLALIGSATGAYNGWIKVVGTVDLNHNGWDGPFRVDVFDPSGATVFTDNGRFTGRPIGVERLN